MMLSKEFMIEKLETLKERALKFGSLGTCPYYMMMIPIEDNSILMDLEIPDDILEVEICYILAIFRRMDFNILNLRDYYSLSPEFINAQDEIKENAIGSLICNVMENNALNIWIDQKISTFEGFIEGNLRSLTINYFITESFNIQSMNPIIPNTDLLKLEKIFCIA
jgi:hypothetical protein